MTLQDLLKQPLSLLLENHIEENMVPSSGTISELVDRISTQLSNGKDFSEFLIVITEPGNIVNAVITNREIPRLLEIIKGTSDFTQLISTLNLSTIFQPRYILRDTDVAEAALNMMKSNLTDMVVVLTQANQYIGKIGRSSLAKRLATLLN